MGGVEFSVGYRFNFSLVSMGLEMVLHLPFDPLGGVMSYSGVSLVTEQGVNLVVIVITIHHYSSVTFVCQEDDCKLV